MSNTFAFNYHVFSEILICFSLGIVCSSICSCNADGEDDG